MPKSQCHLTLEKIFSSELVKDLLALFFRMSSLNLPLLVAFSGIVLLEIVYRKKKKQINFNLGQLKCIRPGSAHNMFIFGHKVTTQLCAQCPFLKPYFLNFSDQQTLSPQNSRPSASAKHLPLEFFNSFLYPYSRLQLQS